MKSFYSFEYVVQGDNHRHIHLMYVDIDVSLGCRQFQVYATDSKDERDVTRMQRWKIISNTTVFNNRVSGVGLLVFGFETAEGERMPCMLHCKGILREGIVRRMKKSFARIGYNVQGSDEYKHVSFPLTQLDAADIVIAPSNSQPL